MVLIIRSDEERASFHWSRPLVRCDIGRMEPLIKATGSAWILQLNAGVFACSDDLCLNIAADMDLDPIRIITKEALIFRQEVIVEIVFVELEVIYWIRVFGWFVGVVLVYVVGEIDSRFRSMVNNANLIGKVALKNCG